MNCKNCSNNIPDGLEACSVCGEPCAVKPKKKGVVIALGVVAFTLTAVIALVILSGKGFFDKLGKEVVTLISGDDIVCDCCRNYELRKAKELVTDGFEEMGADVSGVESVYSLAEDGAEYFLIKGEIFNTVNKESEYYNPEMEPYVGGYFIAEACWGNNDGWAVYGIYKADEKDVFKAELKEIIESRKENEEKNRKLLRDYADDGGISKDGETVELKIRNHIKEQYAGKEDTELAGFGSQRKVSIDGAYYQLVTAKVITNGEHTGIFVAEVCVVNGETEYFEGEELPAEYEEDLEEEIDDWNYDYPDEEIIAALNTLVEKGGKTSVE